MGRKCTYPDYNPERVLTEMISITKECYLNYRSYRYVATELDLSVSKVIKLLITGGVYNSEICRDINRLYNSGKTVTEIQKKLHVSRATVQAYLPYKKGVYNAKECSRNAERIKVYRRRQQVLKELAADMCEEKLWEAIEVFQGYPFYMGAGDRFTYTVCFVNNGNAVNDFEDYKGILVCQGEEGFGINWESILSVFNEIIRAKQEGEKYVEDFVEAGKEKFIYVLLIRFCVI